MARRSFIDPHVHLRGREYPSHPMMRYGFDDAAAVGIIGLAEQPNPDPQLTSLDTISLRMKEAEGHRQRTNVAHTIHMGLTNNLSQVREAFESVISRKHGLSSVKAFWVHSTGNMGILDEDIQENIWKMAGEMNYHGVFFQHCEYEPWFQIDFDSSRPITHSQRQHEGAELVQVMRQLRFAYDSGFEGKFYVAHVSSPETIEYLESERCRGLPFRIIAESTFHHLFLNTDDYAIHGNNVKMNPPLRAPAQQKKLLEQCINGFIDIIGSDHAPHPVSYKEGSSPRSGISALPFWPKGVDLLEQYGMSEERIHTITFERANRLFFDGKLVAKENTAMYDPTLWKKYGFNPNSNPNSFSRIDGS